jgi:AraC-like DNA-binding protein
MREAPTDPTVSAVHALHLAELVQRWGVSPGDLLEGVGLREEALTEPDARLPVPVLVRLIERARSLTGERALGVYLGLQTRVSAHGYLGFAAMTASTLREAIDLAVRFAPTRTTAFALRLHVEGAASGLLVEERADFGAARDAVLLSLMVGLAQVGNAITGRELPGRADFAFPEPDYWARVAGAVPTVRFGQPANQLVFDAALLDLSLTMSDRASLRLAQEQCERSLGALGDGGQLVARVRGLVTKKDGGARPLEDAAAQLHMSPRTLKRRLAEQGVTYSALAEGERRERALLLLRSPELSLDEVADRVGYSDVANFTRAFRRWTGKTPASYRRELGGGRS